MKYSFIIPVYGCEEYLRDCVSSILNQQGEHDFEILLVDDGSKDRSGQIADELAGEHSCIRVFHKENGGAASARNYGIREAVGEYLIFIDGDDTVEDNLLQQVDETLCGSPDALVIFGMSFDYYLGTEMVRQQRLSCSHKGAFPVVDLLENFQDFFYDNALSSACNKVFSAEILKNHSLQFREGMTLYEDYDLVLRYLRYIDEVICIDYPFYHYRNALETVHLNERIQSMEKLKQNMLLLMESVVGLENPSKQVYQVTANLYMSLLLMHLRMVPYSAKQLAAVLPDYCNVPLFEHILREGAVLGMAESQLLSWTRNGMFRKIKIHFLKKRWISKTKNLIKTALRKVGIVR